jgi:hypothetical protein
LVATLSTCCEAWTVQLRIEDFRLRIKSVKRRE